MKKCLAIAALSLFSLCHCSVEETLGTTDGAAPTVSSFSPSAGSTDVSLTADVVATFSEALDSATVTTSTVTVTAAGSTTTVCSSMTYDATAKTATCAHTTPFANSTVYTITVTTGIKDTSGNALGSEMTSTFTSTATKASVSTMVNTSVASTANSNTVTLSFNFASAVPAGLTPTVTVVDQNSVFKTVSGCTFNNARTQLGFCAVVGVTGCTTFTDYVVTLSGTGFTTYTSRFNSSDDEFDAVSSTSGTCWTAFTGAVSTDTSSTGTIKTTVVNSGSTPATQGPIKSFNPAADIAFATKITARTDPTGCANLTGGSTNLRFHFDGGGSTVEYGPVKFKTTLGSVTVDWVLNETIDDVSSIAYATSGALAGTINAGPPYYFCLTRRSGIIRTFISTDGTTYLPMVASELSFAPGLNGLNLTMASMIATDSNDAPTTTTNLEMDFDNSCTNSTYISTVDYFRFRSNFSGSASASDCPRF